MTGVACKLKILAPKTEGKGIDCAMQALAREGAEAIDAFIDMAGRAVLDGVLQSGASCLFI